MQHELSLFLIACIFQNENSADTLSSGNWADYQLAGQRCRPLQSQKFWTSVCGVQAFANVVRRMMEASGRGMWNASEGTLAQLRSILNDIEDELEGVK